MKRALLKGKRGLMLSMAAPSQECLTAAQLWPQAATEGLQMVPLDPSCLFALGLDECTCQQASFYTASQCVGLQWKTQR